MAADRPAAAVVGGGIAGLAAAVSLAQAGWQVTVLERAAAFGEVGAGLAITGNGMTALTALGLDAAVRAVAHETTSAGFQDPSGRWLIRIPQDRLICARSRQSGACTASACTACCAPPPSGPTTSYW